MADTNRLARTPSERLAEKIVRDSARRGDAAVTATHPAATNVGGTFGTKTPPVKTPDDRIREKLQEGGPNRPSTYHATPQNETMQAMLTKGKGEFRVSPPESAVGDMHAHKESSEGAAHFRTTSEPLAERSASSCSLQSLGGGDLMDALNNASGTSCNLHTSKGSIQAEGRAVGVGAVAVAGPGADTNARSTEEDVSPEIIPRPDDIAFDAMAVPTSRTTTWNSMPSPLSEEQQQRDIPRCNFRKLWRIISIAAVLVVTAVVVALAVTATRTSKPQDDGNDNENQVSGAEEKSTAHPTVYFPTSNPTSQPTTLYTAPPVPAIIYNRGPPATSNSFWTSLGQVIEGVTGRDRFGTSISLSYNGTIVAASSSTSESLEGSGYAAVYQLHDFGWGQLGGSIPGDQALDRSGAAIALSGDGLTVAIGSPQFDGFFGVGSGKVRVFRYDGASLTWIQVGRPIYGTATNDNAGTSVALNQDGSKVVIGSPKYSSFDPERSENMGKTLPRAGQVRVFELKSEIEDWFQLGTDIHGFESEQRLGGEVSMSASGNRVAVGPHRKSSSDFVRVLNYDDRKEDWVQVGKTILGKALSLSGNGLRLAVSVTQGNKTSVVAYHNVGAKWEQIGQTLPVGIKSGNELSIALSFDGTRVLLSWSPRAGQAGKAKIFEHNDVTDEWEQVGETLQGEDEGGDGFGFSVAISANGYRMAVGAIGNTTSENDADVAFSGRVQVYEY